MYRRCTFEKLGFRDCPDRRSLAHVREVSQGSNIWILKAPTQSVIEWAMVAMHNVVKYDIGKRCSALAHGDEPWPE